MEVVKPSQKRAPDALATSAAKRPCSALVPYPSPTSCKEQDTSGAGAVIPASSTTEVAVPSSTEVAIPASASTEVAVPSSAEVAIPANTATVPTAAAAGAGTALHTAAAPPNTEVAVSTTATADGELHPTLPKVEIEAAASGSAVAEPTHAAEVATASNPSPTDEALNAARNVKVAPGATWQTCYTHETYV